MAELYSVRVDVCTVPTKIVPDNPVMTHAMEQFARKAKLPGGTKIAADPKAFMKAALALEKMPANAGLLRAGTWVKQVVLHTRDPKANRAPDDTALVQLHVQSVHPDAGMIATSADQFERYRFALRLLADGSADNAIVKELGNKIHKRGFRVRTDDVFDVIVQNRKKLKADAFGADVLALVDARLAAHLSPKLTFASTASWV